jgi:hypothetical protein
MKKKPNIFKPLLKNITIVIFVFFILAGTAFLIWKPEKIEITSCTEETKLCSDGSSVGRTGPDCEFSECPIPQMPEIKTYDEENFLEGMSTLIGNKYVNERYNFSFEIPSTWVFQKEEKGFSKFEYLNIDLIISNFKEKTPPITEHILSISVIDRTFEEEYQQMDWNVGKEIENKIIIDNKEGVKRIGKNEWGEYLTVVILPNENYTIEFVLRTNEEPYISKFNDLLNSFKFIE